MSILVTILLILAGIIVLFLLLGLFMKKDHYIRREIVINAPRDKVFGYVRLLENQEKFNKWAAADADRKKEFRGTDGTVGFVYAWSGNKDAGEGEKEIKAIIEGKRIETEMRFVKPMKAVAHVVMETESINDDHTRVYWSNAGRFNYPLNVLIPMMEAKMPKAMDESLANLKNILESNS